jgi:beta-N-acetylglucosaminidase
LHDRSRRIAAAGLAGLLLAAFLAVPAAADTPHPVRAPKASTPHPVPVAKAEPRRVSDYHPNQPITYDTDLLSQSGYAAWMIDELLSSTTPLPNLGAAFIRAERATGINARYLVAHAILETGWGTSWIAQAKHNLFGYGAFDRDPARFAIRFPTYAAGIAAVSDEIRTSYLSPDGRWWRGFPTLRGVNRFYASDPLWADKIVVLANAIDYLIVTLRERGLQFGVPRVVAPSASAPVRVGSRMVVALPWTTRTLGLPDAIRFAVRWTPVALAEGDSSAPAAPVAAAWSLVAKATRAGQIVNLAVSAPSLPGSWRLDIEARDSDGSLLPPTDARPIRSLAVRVVAATESAISVGVDPLPAVATVGRATTVAFTTPVAFAQPAAPGPPAGGLGGTIRNVGQTVIPAAAADGTPTLVEAWSLPLAASGAAAQLMALPLAANLAPGGALTVRFPAPSGTAVVVLRLSGDPGAIGRSVSSVSLFDASVAGRATVTPLAVPDLRDADLAAAGAAPAGAAQAGAAPAGAGAKTAPVAKPPSPPAPTPATVSIVPADAVGEVAIGLAPGPAWTGPRIVGESLGASPRILARTLSTPPADAADPTAALLPWPGDRTRAAGGILDLAGVPAGIRLVVVGLVPDGTLVVDPATLRLAWVRVATPRLGPTPR